MPPRVRSRSVLAAALLLLSAAGGSAAQACPDIGIAALRPAHPSTAASCGSGADEKTRCIRLGYTAALGREPSASDYAYWQARPAMSIAEYREVNLKWLVSPLGTGEVDAVLNRIGHTALGRNPNTTERAVWAARLRDGQDHNKQVEALRLTLHDTDQGSGERRAVINRAYMASYGRLPLISEIDAVHQCYSYEMVTLVNTMRMYQPEGAAELTGTIRRAWLTRWKKQPTQAQIAAWIAPAGAQQMRYEQLRNVVQ
jgi:hypothetical protein